MWTDLWGWGWGSINRGITKLTSHGRITNERGGRDSNGRQTDRQNAHAHGTQYTHALRWREGDIHVGLCTETKSGKCLLNSKKRRGEIRRLAGNEIRPYYLKDHQTLLISNVQLEHENTKRWKSKGIEVNIEEKNRWANSRETNCGEDKDNARRRETLAVTTIYRRDYIHWNSICQY